MPDQAVLQDRALFLVISWDLMCLILVRLCLRRLLGSETLLQTLLIDVVLHWSSRSPSQRNVVNSMLCSVTISAMTVSPRLRRRSSVKLSASVVPLFTRIAMHKVLTNPQMVDDRRCRVDWTSNIPRNRFAENLVVAPDSTEYLLSTSSLQPLPPPWLSVLMRWLDHLHAPRNEAAP